MTSYFAKEAIVAIVPYNADIKLKAKLDKAERKYRLAIKKDLDVVYVKIFAKSNIRHG